jgi:ADP-ribose pyrophosphatase YjhB (NUDIX family)
VPYAVYLCVILASCPQERRTSVTLDHPWQINGYNSASGFVMKREFPEIPLVGVGAIVIEGDRVLLVKRAHPPLQAQWSIPGGVLEVGERVREAAVREAREETGLIVEPGELLGVYDRILRDVEERVQYHYVLVDFLCRRIGGELLAADDATEVRFFTRDELPAMNLAEDTQDVIRKGFEKLGTPISS